MKPLHIIAMLMVVGAIGIFLFTGKDMTNFKSFAEAKNAPSLVKVSGELSKDKEIYYDPQTDANFLSFFMKDGDGQEKKVILRAAKPQDFERSEQLVLTGKIVGEEFHARDMLMKCPSKYKDEEVYIKSELANK